MTEPLTLGSLFDGIGGFPLAGVGQGFTPVWASEIEPFPIEVTQLRFPEMCHVGDITKLDGAQLTPVDVVCGGSPCQDLSVAGKRAGLQGERSGLFMEQVRVIKEMRAYDKANGRPANAVRPRYMCWENVPGAFSSSESEDFRAVLEETCRIADSTVSIPRPPGGVWKSAGAILGDQFSVAWRVYDAQYWPRTPQRRKRIYLVADFGGHTASQILFEQDRLFGDSAQGEETRQGTAACSETSAGDPGRSSGAVGGRSGECLTPWDVQSRRIYEGNGVWPSLYGGEGGGHGYITEEKSEPVTIPINTQIATRHERMGEGTGLGIGADDDPAFTLQASHSHAVFHSAPESETIAFACNQRDEVRNLNDVSGAIQAQPGMKQQTFVAQFSEESGVQQPNCLTPWDTQQERIFTEDSIAPTLAGADGGGGRNPGGLMFSAGVVTKGNGECFLTPEQHTSLTSGGEQAGQGYPCVLTAGFCAGAGPAAGGIGYSEEISPTLKAAESGTNMVPSILCLNDQGGGQMYCSENQTGTLRAQEHGHQPLILDSQPELFENHGIDSRYTGPHPVAPTMSARYGTGGNNVPLISQPAVLAGESGEALVHDSTYCIAGNIIDRQDHNGGNGLGVQPDISYTVTSTDRHCVFSQQRSDEYAPNEVVSTQSARQYKDATDLICEADVAGLDCRNGVENGDLSGTLQSKTNGGYSLNNVHPIRIGKLIRRLTPLECERLQGYPDYWTDIPGASDSARYKALGNSVAIPCVVHVLRGIAYFLRKFKLEQEESECTSTPTT